MYDRGNILSTKELFAKEEQGIIFGWSKSRPTPIWTS
jgi:hypothetical protein